jgi:tRNA(Ile)-lysidine synthase
MKGSKKLSDFFIDNKIERAKKEQVWLLCSGDNIVWVIGYRIDDRYKIGGKTKRVLIASLK